MSLLRIYDALARTSCTTLRSWNRLVPMVRMTGADRPGAVQGLSDDDSDQIVRKGQRRQRQGFVSSFQYSWRQAVSSAYTDGDIVPLHAPIIHFPGKLFTTHRTAAFIQCDNPVSTVDLRKHLVAFTRNVSTGIPLMLGGRYFDEVERGFTRHASGVLLVARAHPTRGFAPHGDELDFHARS